MDTITIMVCRQKDVNDVKASPGKRPVQCAIQCFAIRTEMLWHFRIVRDQLVQEISIACDDRERIYYRECPGITGRAWNAEWKIQEGFQLLKLVFMGKNTILGNCSNVSVRIFSWYFLIEIPVPRDQRCEMGLVLIASHVIRPRVYSSPSQN